MREVDIEIGSMIRTKRKLMKMNQTQLGQKLGGLAAMTISQYESGKRQMDLLTFFKICHILNIDIDEVDSRLDYYLNKYEK